MLLKEDSRSDQIDKFGRTPLAYLKFMGVRHNDSDMTSLQMEIAKEFMGAWKSLDAKDDDGMTALHHIVEFLNDENIERYYLKRDREANSAAANTADKAGRTPLHIAVLAERGEVAASVASVLLRHGAERSTKDSSGMTPLMLACKTGQAVVATVLLDYTGVDAERDHGGKTALHYAVEPEKFSSGQDLAALMENAKEDSNVRFSSAQAPPDETTHLASMDIIDSCDHDGRTPLHEAILADNATVARALLGHGADVKLKDRFGRNSLHHAAESNQIGNPPAEESLIFNVFNA
ncbi:ankyrin, partial [Byssothecium circinans]